MIYKIIGSLSNVLCIALGACTMAVIAIGPEVIYIMGGEKYMEAIWCIPPIVMGVYFSFCYGLFCNVEFYLGITKYIAVASSVGAIVNIVLNAIFILIFGYVAAAYTTLVCYILLAIAHYLIMRKVTTDKIFQMKSMVGISCALIGLQIVFTFSYSYVTIRAIMLLMILIFVFVKRKYFLESIKSIRR